METFRKWLRWATGWTLISLFYAHTLIQAETTAITPIASIVLAGLMSVTGVLWLLRPPPPRGTTTVRGMALFLFIVAISLWMLSGLYHYLINPPSPRDLGELGIYCLIPILVLLNRERDQLITFVARLCVIMTIADFVFNILVIFGLLSPVISGGQLLVNGIRLDRHPGISGNILSAGEVAVIGVIYSAWRTRCDPQKIPRFVWFLILALCLVGLHLVVARRYEVAGIIGAAVILIPWARLVPLPIYAFIQGGVGLYFTFTSLDPEEILRSRLMLAGAEDLSAVFWLGRGPYFSAPVKSPAFLDMWAGGITESGVLDLALAFGAPSVAIFLTSVVLALLAKRAIVSWIPVVVTVLAGTLAYNNPLSFLGSVVFFGALLSVIMQEVAERPTYPSLVNQIGGVAMIPG